MKIDRLFEETVKLSDMYDVDDLHDDAEILYHYIDPDQLDDEFEVKELSFDEAKKLKTPRGDMTVWQAYKDHAMPEQEDIIKKKLKNYDSDRVIVVYDDQVLDGNHHLIASLKQKLGVRLIDIKTI
jgi:hypothetical protein